MIGLPPCLSTLACFGVGHVRGASFCRACVTLTDEHIQVVVRQPANMETTSLGPTCAAGIGSGVLPSGCWGAPASTKLLRSRMLCFCCRFFMCW